MSLGVPSDSRKRPETVFRVGRRANLHGTHDARTGRIPSTWRRLAPAHPLVNRRHRRYPNLRRVTSRPLPQEPTAALPTPLSRPASNTTGLPRSAARTDRHPTDRRSHQHPANQPPDQHAPTLTRRMTPPRRRRSPRIAPLPIRHSHERHGVAAAL
jgi:hypothetical protein